MSSPKLITKGMAWILDGTKSPPEVYIAGPGLQAGYGESPVKNLARLDLCTCAKIGAMALLLHSIMLVLARALRALSVCVAPLSFYKGRRVKAKYDRTEKQVYSAIKAIHV